MAMSGRRVFGLAAAFAAIIAGPPAFADAITLTPADIGRTITVSYDELADGEAIDGLSGTATFTLTGIEDRSYTGTDFSAYVFDFTVTNTSANGVYSTISSIGFRTSPDLILAGLANNTDPVFTSTRIYTNYPGSVGDVDVCFRTSSSENCGDAVGGVAPGSTISHGFILGFSNPITSVTIDDFFMGYQSVSGAGSLTSTTGIGTIQSGSSGGVGIPEPGMLVLFGLGVAALGFRRRRAVVG